MQFNENQVKKLLPKRPKDSHKGTFGHVLNIAGSGFYSGAAYFSSIAPLKVGCGLCTLASTETVIKAVSALSPDIIYLLLAATKEKTISAKDFKKLGEMLDSYDVISIGCGLSTNKDTIKFFNNLSEILSRITQPVVIDADGLNILANLESPKLPDNLILTPHPKELARLMRMSVENILTQPEYWAKKCCEKYNCTTVLKTHNTIVAENGDRIYINNTGNSSLSHGGSGDVLCGMISGFLAQGLQPFEASSLAVYLHGKSSEIASKELTEYSTSSSDLLKYIPSAIKSIL